MYLFTIHAVRPDMTWYCYNCRHNKGYSFFGIDKSPDHEAIEELCKLLEKQHTFRFSRYLTKVKRFRNKTCAVKPHHLDKMNEIYICSLDVNYSFELGFPSRSNDVNFPDVTLKNLSRLI